MVEEWKSIPNYEGLYEVSNLGNIRSYYNNKHGISSKAKLIKSAGKYSTIPLVKNGIKKTFYIHRLVATIFLENPNNYQEVNHIDGNKKNNCVSNLEWVSHQQNMEHARINNMFGMNKKVYCVEENKIYPSVTALGKTLGISQSRMSIIIHSNRPYKGKMYILEEKNNDAL